MSLIISTFGLVFFSKTKKGCFLFRRIDRNKFLQTRFSPTNHNYLKKCRNRIRLDEAVRVVEVDAVPSLITATLLEDEEVATIITTIIAVIRQTTLQRRERLL